MPVRGGKRQKNRGVSVCLCVNDNESTEGPLVTGSLCWPVKELESESTIQTTARPRTPSHTAAQRLRGKQTRFTEKLLRAVKASLVCVFPQGGGKTSQGLAAAKRGFVFDPDA